MKRYICIHGHFYQPPRENPWLEEVELQDSAHPFHDWNQRITAECYGPNSGARILDEQGRIAKIVNNYSLMSFNFGPTLLSWMERRQPAVYEAILEADRLSRQRFGGHGSAMAQVYNHMIEPLANDRDRRTQIHWGVEDFIHRFGRDPEGMWLPETAADTATLEALADAGIKFTILAPRQAHQVAEIPKAAGREPERTLAKGPARKTKAPVKTTELVWEDVSGDRIDPTRGYRCSLPSGKSITLFFYDGPISQELAFSDLLKSGARFKDRLTGVFNGERSWPQLVHIATDGETYGHHHRYGEMALAWLLDSLDNDEDFTLTNYSRYLAENPPTAEARIHENSSWSCIHGVERWKQDCGCNSGMNPGWGQQWRTPLRESMNWLRDRAADVFEDTGPKYLKDPWRAREDYIEVVLDRSYETINDYLARHEARPLPPEDVVHALKLLEMQRYAQLIFTSCAWFFDEVSGIETVQVLQYAARTIQLLEELTGKTYEDEFLQRLGEAKSNLPNMDDGAEVFERYVKPAEVDMLRVAAHFAMSSFFEEPQEVFDYACYHVRQEQFQRFPAGRMGLAVGRAQVTSMLTRDAVNIAYAVLHAGDHNLSCGVRFFQSQEAFKGMLQEMRDPFERGDLTEAIRSLDNHFGKHTYSVWHLFKDDQRRLVDHVLEPAYQLAEAAYHQIYDGNHALLNFLSWLNMPCPRHFLDAAQFVVNNDLKTMFEQDAVEPAQVTQLLTERSRWALTLEEAVGHAAAGWVNRRMAEFDAREDDLPLLEHTVECLEAMRPINLGAHIWEAQHTCFRKARGPAPHMGKEQDRWTRRFDELCDLLGVAPA